MREERDRDAILGIASIAVGSTVMVLIEAAATPHRWRGLGCLGFWIVAFPFARRTWAAAVPASSYWTTSLTATAVGAAVRLLTR